MAQAQARIASQMRSCYRQILRELPLRDTSASINSSPLRRQIRDYFGTRTSTSAEKSLETHVASLSQFVQYFKAQRTYLTLLERYNPGMSMSEEDKLRLTARRVGMDLPSEWKNGA